jgi:hypothetical protein
LRVIQHEIQTSYWVINCMNKFVIDYVMHLSKNGSICHHHPFLLQFNVKY